MRRFGHCLVALSCLSLGACSLFSSGDDDEPEPATLVEFDATTKVDKVWDAGLGGDAKGLRLGLVPASNGARVFAASFEGQVEAYDAITGTRVWRTDTDLPLTGGPGVGRDRIAAGSSEGDLITLAIEDGTVLWQKKIGSEILAAPAFTSDKVIVRTGDGRLIAYNADDGEQLWEVTKRVQGLTLRGNSVPVVSGERVISGFDDGTLASVNVADGVVAWERPTSERRGRTEFDRLADVDGRVAVIGEDVFAVGFQGTAALLSASTGTPVWRQDISSHQSVALDWNRVYMTRADDTVIALNRASGVIVWEQSALSLRGVTGPAVIGSLVVVGDFDGYVHFMDAATGEFVARKRVASGPMIASPLVVGDVLLTLGTDGSLTALRPAQPTAPTP
ncbi:MAG: outer membrane protein assembly factor BamB [Gammaproteobacteria bacterium]